jgi:vacuolar-type H+-ATPase subunit E/Vma4
MTLERIESHITEKAQAEADALAEKTREECDAVVAEAKAEADDEYETAVARLKADLANDYEQAVGKVESDHRRALLAARTRILDEVFEKATTKLREHSSYAAIVKKNLSELAGLDGRIRCRAEDKDAIAKMAAELKDMPPVADEPVAIAGGFVFESEKFDLDYSLDTQIETFREAALTDLLNEAFPKG